MVFLLLNHLENKREIVKKIVFGIDFGYRMSKEKSAGADFGCKIIFNGFLIAINMTDLTLFDPFSSVFELT